MAEDVEKVGEPKKWETFIAMLLRADRKKRSKIEELISDERTKLFEATEGGALAGDKYPLEDKHHKAVIEAIHILDTVQDIWLRGYEESFEYELLKKEKERLFTEYYLRSQTSRTIVKPIAETISDFANIPETPKATKKEEKKEEKK